MSAFLAPAASAVSGASPGDLKHSFAASLTGWLNASTGGSVGNAASGATLRANSDASALFAVIWNNVPDEQAPIYDSGGTQTARGASAAADFAAGKRLMIPPMAGAPDRQRHRPNHCSRSQIRTAGQRHQLFRHRRRSHSRRG